MADDYSEIATPVAKLDDYSEIAEPVKQSETQESLEAAAKENIKKGLKLENVSLKNTFRPSSIIRGLKIALGSPWQSYEKSVEQAYKGPEIPRVEADPGTGIVNRAGQVGAAVDNTIAGVGSGLVSPGAAANIISPATLLYSAPHFVVGGLKNLMKAATDDKAGLQERVEAGLGGTLEITGGAMGAKGGVAPLNVLAKLEPKSTSIIPAVDDASSHTNPVAANAAANEIATKPVEAAPEPIKAPAQQAPVVEPKVAEPPVIGPETTKLQETPGGREKLAILKEAIANPDVTVQYSVWPEEMVPKGGERTMQVDLIDKNNPQAGGLGSFSRKVLEEHGVYAPKAPDSLPPGSYTIDQIKAAIAKEKEPIQELKTKAQLIKEIKDKNPNSDLEAPRQLLGKGKYEVRDIPLDEIGEVFGKNTVQKDVVARYVKNPSSDPIILADVDGELRPVDGKHRLTAAIERGDETIKAYVPVDSEVGKPASVNTDKKAYLDELLATKEITPEEHAQQLGDSTPDPYSEIASPVAETPPFSLPKELAGAKPRYSYGENQFQLKFESELDKALYIIAQKKPSARDADYLRLVTDHLGLDESEARAAGAAIRDQIKQLAKSDNDGATLVVPDSGLTPTSRVSRPVEPSAIKPNAIQVQSPESVSVPAQASVSQEVVPEVRSGGKEPAQPRQAEAQVASGGGGANVPPAQIAAPSPSFNNPLPNQGWTPFISKTKAGQMIKAIVGTIEGNIRKVAPEVFGALRERGFKLNEMKKGWHDTSKDYGEIARKYLKPEAFTELDRLLQSGLHDQALAFIKGSRYEPELKTAIASFKQSLDAMRDAEVASGREVGDVNNYWLREVADYEGLRRELGRDPSHAAEKALKNAAEQKKRPLTQEEEEAVINNLISTSFSGQGKPGFLNPRTIGEIQKNWFKYYEPSDVAMENRINRVARDVVNRAYFGKFDPSGPAAPMSGAVGSIEGNFGDIINRMIKEGTLSAEGSKVVVRNLQDFFQNDTRFDDTSSGLANKLRKAQTYAYLGDMANAIPQYGDFFLGAWRNGLFDASKGFFVNRKFKLSDIGLHEGNPDTAVFSKKNNEGLVGKVFRNSVNLFLGVSDRFNKGGLLNTSFHEAARDMRNPNSATYKELDTKWSERFPDRWPEIKKDLQSQAFAKGDLNPNTRFFLYSELADLQPISGEATAQAFNRAGPWGKILYGLRSFAIKQIDVMRQEGYEKMRTPGQRFEGLKNLVTYALIVGAGQQFVGSYLRDKLLDRETDPSEYAVSGLLQLMGFNRYSLYRAKEQGIGTAALEMAVPGVGILNDLTQSLGVARDYVEGRRSQKTGAKTVPTFADALASMEATKYIPGVGREVYSYFGLGRKKEDARRLQKAKGKPQASTIQQISDMIVSPDKKN